MSAPAAPLSLWRRLWLSLPLAYKLVLLGLGAVMTVTLAVMVGTYVSAGESLKLQLERQLSRDLNVTEKWYRTRQEEMQLTAVGLARHAELARAIAAHRLTPAASLLKGEQRRLNLDLVLLLDADGRPLDPDGPGPHFDPDGLFREAMARHEAFVTTEAWDVPAVAGLPPELRRPGLVRLVVTPLVNGGTALGVLVLGDWLGAGTALPSQVTALIGGAVAVLDREHVVAADGLPPAVEPRLAPALWADVRDGRLFFAEQDLGGRPYMLAFRPIIDARGRTVGAFMRGFPESEISETLSRYAGGIFLLTAAAIVFSVLVFLWLTRRLLFPLRRLAHISASLAAGDAVELPAGGGGDELGSLTSGVAKLADRLVQSREELAEAAFKLEGEAARLAALHAEKAKLLEALRDHDRLRGQLIEKIITAQEDERKRIARELHDQTGQSLTSLLVGLKYLEGAPDTAEMRRRAGDLRALTLATLEEVHQLSVALRPAMLDDLGLAVALRSLIAEFSNQHGIDASFLTEGLDTRLPPLWEVTLYRIVQEALTNVAKYAGAQRVEVALQLVGARLTLAITDDGRGFEPARVARDGREHLGLLGMEERVALIGGAFRLQASPGGGTRVEVTASLPAPIPPRPLKESPRA